MVSALVKMALSRLFGPISPEVVVFLGDEEGKNYLDLNMTRRLNCVE